MSLIITHNHGGFFSCCSVRLHKIVKYINSNKKIPDNVDSSNVFGWYKNKPGDITFDYFKHSNDIKNITISYSIKYLDTYQYSVYNSLDYDNIIPIVKKYFTPSEGINNIIQNIEKKYSVIYNNICVLFYRGNDKNRETKICSYTEYLDHAKLIIKKKPDISFLIQSDETDL